MKRKSGLRGIFQAFQFHILRIRMKYDSKISKIKYHLKLFRGARSTNIKGALWLRNLQAVSSTQIYLINLRRLNIRGIKWHIIFDR